MSIIHTVNRDNFEDFYLRHYQMVYRLCYTYMKNSYDAEDCTQDTFLKVLNGSYAFNDLDHERAWLTVTCINLCKDRLKQFWRRNVVVDEQIETTAKSLDKGMDYLLEEILNLPDKYKDVILLHYYMGYKTDEIATLLNRNPSTIRNQLAAGRKMLKDILEEENESE